MHSLVRILLIVLATGLPFVAQAQADRSSSLQQPLFPKLEYVNIGAELGLRNDMLRGFGARVDDARRSADASMLASQAILLSFAEELCSKKASTVTAMHVLEEAVRITEEQRNFEAANVILAAARRIHGSTALIERLNDSMALFSAQRGDGSFLGFIRVVNDSERALDIYVDGSYKGFLFDGEEHVYSTGNGTTVVRATDAFGNTAAEVFNLQPEQTIGWTIAP